MTDFTSSELSDKDIMARTTVERQAASGRLQLTFKLPITGAELVRSIQESSKASGITTWCATVNEAIRNERAEDRARQRKAAALARAPIAVVGSTSATPVAIPGTTGTPSDTSAVQSLSSDPHAFVREQLAAAQLELTEAAAHLAAAQLRLTAAQNRAVQWDSVARSLGLGPIDRPEALS